MKKNNDQGENKDDGAVLTKAVEKLVKQGEKLDKVISIFENTVQAGSRLVGWGLRTFRSRSKSVMLTLLKSLVQPRLDYCSQLWSPSDQNSINKLELLQKQLVDRIRCKDLSCLNYWEKLSQLKLYSQERRRE